MSHHHTRSPQPAESGTNNFLGAREEYLKNKNTQSYQNKAKSLLYGGDSRPITPVHAGRKSVPHAGEHGSAPFATYDGATLGLDKPPASHAPSYATSQYSPPQEATAGQLHRTKVKKGGADKVSSTQYNPDVYRQAIIGNAANLSAMKTRNWGSAGLLGQHPSTPKVQEPSLGLTEADYGSNQGYDEHSH